MHNGSVASQFIKFDLQLQKSIGQYDDSAGSSAAHIFVLVRDKKQTDV